MENPQKYFFININKLSSSFHGNMYGNLQKSLVTGVEKERLNIKLTIFHRKVWVTVFFGAILFAGIFLAHILVGVLNVEMVSVRK